MVLIFFVVVDQFSKMEILAPCKKSVTTKDNAIFFFKNVWVHFSFPNTIVYDRYNKFLSIFWLIFCFVINTKFPSIPILMDK
jgi:hypothetical protein